MIGRRGGWVAYERDALRRRLRGSGAIASRSGPRSAIASVGRLVEPETLEALLAHLETERRWPTDE